MLANQPLEKACIRLNLKFIDVDKLIEQKEKRTISEIFKDKGEEYFRKIEKKISIIKLKSSIKLYLLEGVLL